MARRRSRKPHALALRKNRRHRRARKGGMMKMLRNPGYGMVQLADAKVAGVPVLPVAGFGLLAYGLYDADDMMERLQRPLVIGGAVAGGLAGYYHGRGMLEKASFLALGAGLGLLVDRFIGE